MSGDDFPSQATPGLYPDRYRQMAQRLADEYGEPVHVLDRKQDLLKHASPTLTCAILDSQASAWEKAKALYTVLPSSREPQR